MKRWTAFRAWLDKHRALLGRLTFELAIVFIGVTAAFALENLREGAQEAAYRTTMIAGLSASLDNTLTHSSDIGRDIGGRLAAFDAAVARGGTPPLPVYREEGGERPPTLAWDAVLSTGAARELEPDMLFRLAQYYNRLGSFGERYIRYNDFTETRVLAMGPDQAQAWDADGRLKPEFAAWVDRLRDLRKANADLVREAGAIRDALAEQR